ncbi:hypothetical protein IMSHALPRED_002357 [Imshaugia aleurites]|uniref:Uncharacterized protein n=1 Tax=Imshaugia aleurites TaxID=172621 RepID=A0A8H3I501_9LECA|nr:hypothetical protein IMSHALPRED_002357 [Imshaugia aleurites]
MTALHCILSQEPQDTNPLFPAKITQSQLMDTTTSASKNDTWQPSWERHLKLSPLLKPYSTAAVVPEGQRPYPELWDICNGCILWLPPKSDIGEIPDPRLSSREPGFFDHPILILAIQPTSPRSATVHFAKMTSLRNRPLEHTHRSGWDRYLPVFPTNPHPTSGSLLRLENEKANRGMVENSYVSVHEGVFSVDYRALRCYAAGQRADGYRCRLKEESFELVRRRLGCSSSAWVETRGLWEEFLRMHGPAAVEEASRLGV